MTKSEMRILILDRFRRVIYVLVILVPTLLFFAYALLNFTEIICADERPVLPAFMYPF